MKRFIALFGVLLILLAACEVSSSNSQTAGLDVSALRTAAAQTVIADTNETATTSAPTATILIPTSGKSLSTNIPETSTPLRSTGPLTVSFIDVGQGDSILIQAPTGETMLIDGGEANSKSLTYLKSAGIQRIDVMVATHPHSDHIGGLVEILKTIPVGRVITNGQVTTTGVYENFLDAISTSKAKYTEVKQGDQVVLGSLIFNVLSPSNTQPTGDLNINSIVLRMVYGENSFLFTGDAQIDSENSMIASGLTLRSTFLKIGHHGSNTSSSPAFLNAVMPTVAIYSAGMGNTYGHPHASTIANLFAINSAIYGTDQNGTIVITADLKGYQVSAAQGGPRAPPTATPVFVIPPTAMPVFVIPPPQQPPSNGAPSGATARCNDGTYSYSQHRSGTCSHHGGVAQWLANLP